MVAWSSFRFYPSSKARQVLSLFNATKNGRGNKVVSYVPIRQSSHKTFLIEPSRYVYAKFKDLVIFYALLAFIPLSAIVFYTNVFIGPAQLREIPEGYEPKVWEYYEHPIQRFFAKYVVVSERERHERNLSSIFASEEKMIIKQQEKKVRELMKERADYQAWYYTAPTLRYIRRNNEIQEAHEGNSTHTLYT